MSTSDDPKRKHASAIDSDDSEPPQRLENKTRPVVVSSSDNDSQTQVKAKSQNSSSMTAPEPVPKPSPSTLKAKGKRIGKGKGKAKNQISSPSDDSDESMTPTAAGQTEEVERPTPMAKHRPDVVGADDSPISKTLSSDGWNALAPGIVFTKVL